MEKNEIKKTTYFKKTKDFIIALFGIIGIIYVLNPTAGLFELIPDVLPLIGNLDEAAALYLIYSSAEYFGINVKSFFKRN